MKISSRLQMDGLLIYELISGGRKDRRETCVKVWVNIRP